jgi:hypothetical protein
MAIPSARAIADNTRKIRWKCQLFSPTPTSHARTCGAPSATPWTALDRTALVANEACQDRRHRLSPGTDAVILI